MIRVCLFFLQVLPGMGIKISAKSAGIIPWLTKGWPRMYCPHAWHSGSGASCMCTSEEVWLSPPGPTTNSVSTGINLFLSITSQLKGWIPHFRKDVLMLCGLNVLSTAARRTWANLMEGRQLAYFRWLFTYPRLNASSEKDFFKGLNMTTSSGWSKWVVWGGKQNNSTLFALASSTNAKVMWLSWLSMVKRRGLSLEACFKKTMRNHLRNSSPSIYPLSEIPKSQSAVFQNLPSR